MTWNSSSQWLVRETRQRFQIFDGTRAITMGEALNYWQTDASFRKFCTDLLSPTSFAAFRWETPALTTATLTHPFEFVLISAPEFTQRKTDQAAFAEHFRSAHSNSSIVSFGNLRGDATLIVPLPVANTDTYNHFAVFLREASEAQSSELWQVIGKEVSDRVSEKPLWLSTAGGGVAWLHIRLDSYPKYYSHSPYTTTS